MTNNEFNFWLNGYFELTGKEENLTLKQLHIIKNHLDLVKTVDGYLDEKNMQRAELIETICKTTCHSRAGGNPFLNMHLR